MYIKGSVQIKIKVGKQVHKSIQVTMEIISLMSFDIFQTKIKFQHTKNIGFYHPYQTHTFFAEFYLSEKIFDWEVEVLESNTAEYFAVREKCMDQYPHCFTPTKPKESTERLFCYFEKLWPFLAFVLFTSNISALKLLLYIDNVIKI